MRLVAELEVDDPKATSVPLREERVVIRPSFASTAIEIGPFVVTLRGDSTLDVEFVDIESGFETSVRSRTLESLEYDGYTASYHLRVTVEDDPIVECEFDDPTDGDEKVIVARRRIGHE